MAVQEEEEQEDLRARLSHARTTARGHRPTTAERAAATIAAYGMWRTIRRARRRTAETKERFALKEMVRPPNLPLSKELIIAGIYAGAEHHLAQPPLPEGIPEPEPEALGTDGRAPAVLPQTEEWWRNEKEKQAANPFTAGGLATVNLKFKVGERPVPPPGRIFTWGPHLRTTDMTPEDANDFLKILAKDTRSKGCEPVRWDEVDVLTPIRLVRHPVTGKARIAHDSRAVNIRLEDAPAMMAKAEEALLKGTVAAKLDLLSAFRHIALAENDRRVLGFTVNGYPFRWNALTFGCNQSPALFAQALEKTMKAINLPGGATVVVYVDDLLIVAGDNATLDTATRTLCERLSAEGWFVALDKLYPYAMAVAPFLGLLVDLRVQRLRVSKVKADRLGKRCEAALERRKVSLADLQKIGGVLAFLAAAAPEAGLCRTGINAATADAERLPGRTVAVKGMLKEDLMFWRDCAGKLPDLTQLQGDDTQKSIDVVTDAAGLPSLAFGGVVWQGGAPTPDLTAIEDGIESWMEKIRAGETITIIGGEVFAGPFNALYASHSSAALEVRAFFEILMRYNTKYGPDSLRGLTIRWYSDSTAATSAVRAWRSKAQGVARECKILLDHCRKWGCIVRPAWVSRELGWQPLADAVSKLRWHRDTPEWRMEEEDVKKACAKATGGEWTTPLIDLFATKKMSVAPAFVSRWPEAGNRWTDAFARHWGGAQRAWAFPPFSAAEAALRHACRGNVDVVVVVPRSVVVPPRLRTCRRVQLPPLVLVDVEGGRPPGACPVPLDAIHAKT